MRDKPAQPLRLPWYWALDATTGTWRRGRIYF
jgi:hypothetical protein